MSDLPTPEPVRVTRADVIAAVTQGWPVIIGIWIAALVGLAVLNTWMGNWPA